MRPSHAVRRVPLVDLAAQEAEVVAESLAAVAEVARATGAPVYCPEGELPLLRNVMAWVPPGFGPFESWEPEHTLGGGERLTLAGLEIEVLLTPGHSPGHLTYALAPAAPPAAGSLQDAAVAPPAIEFPQDAAVAPPATESPRHVPVLLSGDVLFQGSVGRVDLPGGNWKVLERSIGTLLERFPAETTVYPGHMGVTTLGRELHTNPFLTELRAAIGDDPSTAESRAGGPESKLPAGGPESKLPAGGRDERSSRIPVASAQGDPAGR